jgi:transposase
LSGNTVTSICKEYDVSRKTYYKWKNRYNREGVAGLYDQSRAPRTIKYKVTQETEETIIDLRLKRFGCNRIRFRLKRLGVFLSSRTIYKMLRRHGLNILKCKIKNRKYKRFAMKHPNDMVQMDILGPFYLHSSNQRNYIISCIDDCSRKVASKWSERKRSTDVLDVLEEWIMINGKPNKVMHDNGKQFISKIFKHFLERNDMKEG